VGHDVVGHDVGGKTFWASRVKQRHSISELLLFGVKELPVAFNIRIPYRTNDSRNAGALSEGVVNENGRENRGRFLCKEM
jgi:hypothetical protein